MIIDHGPGDAKETFQIVRSHHDFEGEFAGPIPRPPNETANKED
jgi:hypothetical protein